MKHLFYDIAGEITEVITGLDGVGMTLSETFQYINVIENVKTGMNVTLAILIALLVALGISVIWDRKNEKKLAKTSERES